VRQESNLRKFAEVDRLMCPSANSPDSRFLELHGKEVFESGEEYSPPEVTS